MQLSDLVRILNTFPKETQIHIRSIFEHPDTSEPLIEDVDLSIVYDPQRKELYLLTPEDFEELLVRAKENGCQVSTLDQPTSQVIN